MQQQQQQQHNIANKTCTWLAILPAMSNIDQNNGYVKIHVTLRRYQEYLSHTGRCEGDIIMKGW